LERRLAAILAADVVGYSRLMGHDEAGTLERLKALRRELVQPKITERGGRIVKLMGDGLLAEFPSVVEAVQCAVDIQHDMAAREADVADDQRIRLRIGINLGDIIVEGSDIYGDGVNIAARLEGLADPQGICLSGDAYRQVKGKLDARFEDLGERRVKNISEPLRVYRLIVGKEQEDRSESAFDADIGLDFSVPDYPSIAVLPFTIMGDDPEQEFFADGVAEDIITALSKIDRLLVVARNSTFTYKGRAVDVKQVSREQGVRYVLEGSVRKAGNRVRVTAQLIDATTGLHLWAERYDRELEDIFAVQDEITREIVTALDVQLREGEQHRVWSRGTSNLEAWECVRLATDDVLGGAAETQPRARELIDRALELDPNYATAWAMRGWLYFTEADVGGGIGNKEQFDKAQAAAFNCGRRALEADPNCAEAYGMLALTHLNAAEHDKAIEMSEKAIALAPNNAELLGGVASAVMRKSGQPERGAELVKKAMRLCPFYRPGLLRALGNNYRISGRLEEAVACYRESIKRESGYLAAYVNLASALGELGWLEDAREAAREVLRQEPKFTIAAYTSGLSYRNPADLERIAEGLRQAGLPEGGDGPSAEGHPPLPDKPSIAVLPFENISGETAQDHVADGITEEIITTLSKVSKLFVIARSSTLVYKGRGVDIRQVGREQGVQYVLEGSVRSGGKRLRVTAQLIEAATGHHLWAQRYDREADDIFALQDDVTKEIVSALQVELTEGEQARLAAQGTQNAEAWQLTFEGRDLVHAHHKDSVQKGRLLLEQAVGLDESYALAWGALAEAHWKDARHKGWSASPERSLELAVEASDRALALDPENAGFLAMRSIIMTTLGKFEEALALAETALRTAHSEANAIALAAITLGACGKAEPAIQQTRLAMRYCPRYPPWYLVSLAYCYWILERGEEAIAACRAAIAADPNIDLPHLVLAMVHAEAGREPEARHAVESVLRIDPNFSAHTYMAGLPYRDPALQERRRAALKKAGLPD
jgi:adenylate cyclase